MGKNDPMYPAIDQRNRRNLVMMEGPEDRLSPPEIISNLEYPTLQQKTSRAAPNFNLHRAIDTRLNRRNWPTMNQSASNISCH
jgi:hypothetical protein